MQGFWLDKGWHRFYWELGVLGCLVFCLHRYPFAVPRDVKMSYTMSFTKIISGIIHSTYRVRRNSEPISRLTSYFHHYHGFIE